MSIIRSVLIRAILFLTNLLKSVDKKCGFFSPHKACHSDCSLLYCTYHTSVHIVHYTKGYAFGRPPDKENTMGTVAARKTVKKSEKTEKHHIVDAKSAANELLNEYWDNTIPIDPKEIAKKMGLTVVELEMSRDISGILFKESGKDPIIGINQSEHLSNKKFTIAHELGHYVYRTIVESKKVKSNYKFDDEYEYLDQRDDLYSFGKNGEEKFCNEFAVNLLIPDNMIQNEKDDVMSLMAKFKVADVVAKIKFITLRTR